MVLGKDLEKNESALNEGFIEHKMLSERYVVLKSKFSMMQKVELNFEYPLLNKIKAIAF